MPKPRYEECLVFFGALRSDAFQQDKEEWRHGTLRPLSLDSDHPPESLLVQSGAIHCGCHVEKRVSRILLLHFIGKCHNILLSWCN